MKQNNIKSMRAEELIISNTLYSAIRLNIRRGHVVELPLLGTKSLYTISSNNGVTVNNWFYTFYRQYTLYHARTFICNLIKLKKK